MQEARLTQRDQEVLNAAQEHVDTWKGSSSAFLIETGKNRNNVYRVSDLLSIIKKYQAVCATIFTTE